MDFEFTEEQKILKDMLRKFMDNEITPLANEYEEERRPITSSRVNPVRLVNPSLIST